MKKTQHKLPRNFVQSPRIDPVAHAQLNSRVDELSLQLSDSKQKMIDQAKKHNDQILELKDQIEQQKQLLPELVAEIQHYSGFLVSNWRSGWKWLSNWIFALIGYISVFGIPPEVLLIFPGASQDNATAILAIIGFICRFINQSKPKALPPVDRGN